MNPTDVIIPSYESRIRLSSLCSSLRSRESNILCDSDFCQYIKICHSVVKRNSSYFLIIYHVTCVVNGAEVDSESQPCRNRRN